MGREFLIGTLQDAGSESFKTNHMKRVNMMSDKLSIISGI